MRRCAGDGELRARSIAGVTPRGVREGASATRGEDGGRRRGVCIFERCERRWRRSVASGESAGRVAGRNRLAGVRERARGETDGKEERGRARGGRSGRGVDGETRETLARGGGRDVRETVEVSSGIVAVVAKRGGVFVVYAIARSASPSLISAIAQKGGDGLQAVMERDWQGLLTNMADFLSQESPRRW